MTLKEATAHQARHGFLVIANSDFHAADVIRETRKMNKTELEFSLILESKKQKGEISRWIYEGITLRWHGIKYTPDFVVFPTFPGAPPVFIEVKGGFIGGHLARAVERFRHARSVWPEFGFQLHQKKGKQWKRIM